MSATELVGEIEGVRRAARRASFGAAAPLALLGLLVAGAAPFYAMAYGTTIMGGPAVTFQHEPGWTTRVLPIQSSLGGTSDMPLSVYWLVAVPVMFVAIGAYYSWRARRTGFWLDGRRVAAVGVTAYLALLGVMAALRMANGARPMGIGPGVYLNPLLVVMFGVFALARVERSLLVLGVAVTFLLGVFVVDVEAYMTNATASPWDNVRGWGTATLLLGAWLLLGAAASWLVQRRTRA
jgi:hypothetical protein